jgi:hypothetical protein
LALVLAQEADDISKAAVTESARQQRGFKFSCPSHRQLIHDICAPADDIGGVAQEDGALHLWRAVNKRATTAVNSPPASSPRGPRCHLSPSLDP